MSEPWIEDEVIPLQQEFKIERETHKLEALVPPGGSNHRRLPHDRGEGRPGHG